MRPLPHLRRYGWILRDALQRFPTNMKCLQALSPVERQQWDNLNTPPYSAFRDSESLLVPEENTLRWLIEVDDSRPKKQVKTESLSSRDFMRWRDSPESATLLIKGAPGQGKSVLSKFIVQHLEKRRECSEKLQDYKIIYHFCNIRVEQRYQTAEAVIRSLIVQLCEDRHLFLRLPRNIRETGFHGVSFDSLWYHFKTLFSAGTFQTLYCIIDGLDVYGVGVKQLAENLAKLHSNSTTGAPCLKLFFTSRPAPDLPRSLKSRILRSHPEDLGIFIESRVNSMALDIGPNIGPVIIKKLKEKVGQTFLWVAIILRKISQFARTKTVIREVDVLSIITSGDKELDGMYEDLVRRAIENDPVNGLIFACVAFARRTFSVKMLSEAISVGQQDLSELTVDQLERKLGVLLDVVEYEESDVLQTRVYLIHQSLRDFFQSKSPRELRGGLTHDPEFYLAEACTRYLSTGLSEEGKGYNTFFVYARDHWYHHIRTVSDATMLLQYLEQILPPRSTKRKAWMARDPYLRRTASVKDVAIYYDFVWLVEMILNKVSYSLADEIVPNDLVKASRFGVKVLDFLLNHEQTKGFPITEEVVVGAARNRRAEEALTLLFDRRKEDVQITERVLCAAVGDSPWKGYVSPGGTLALLLDRGGKNIQITEAVLREAVKNRYCGRNLLAVLFDRRGEDIKITKGVLRSIATNVYYGEQILTTLLTRRRKELAALMAKDFYYPIETQLLGELERGSPIREELVKKAARCPSKRSIIALLFDRQDKEFLSGRIAGFIINAIQLHDCVFQQNLCTTAPWLYVSIGGEKERRRRRRISALAERRRQAIIQLSIAPS